MDSNVLQIAIEEWFYSLDVDESGMLQNCYCCLSCHVSLPPSNFVLQVRCRSLSFKLAFLLELGADLNAMAKDFDECKIAGFLHSEIIKIISCQSNWLESTEK